MTAFEREQRSVALSMAGALAVTVIVLGIVAIADGPSTTMPIAVRLQQVLRIDVFVVAALAAAIANVARLRFFSPDDIAGSSAGSASPAVRNAAAILQNTAEQTALALATHLIVAATFRAPVPLVTALVGLFVAGRLLFALGYGRGAAGRAFGFALTFYPSVIALLASATVIVLGGAT